MEILNFNPTNSHAIKGQAILKKEATTMNIIQAIQELQTLSLATISVQFAVHNKTARKDSTIIAAITVFEETEELDNTSFYIYSDTDASLNEENTMLAMSAIMTDDYQHVCNTFKLLKASV